MLWCRVCAVKHNIVYCATERRARRVLYRSPRCIILWSAAQKENTEICILSLWPVEHEKRGIVRTYTIYVCHYILCTNGRKQIKRWTLADYMASYICTCDGETITCNAQHGRVESVCNNKPMSGSKKKNNVNKIREWSLYNRRRRPFVLYYLLTTTTAAAAALYATISSLKYVRRTTLL